MKTFVAVQELKSKYREGVIRETDFCGQITVEIEKDYLIEMLVFLKQFLGYEVLMDLTSVDYLEPFKGTKMIYWLHNPVDFERIRICLFTKRGEKIPSVTRLWEGADWYERELYDMFGIDFEGHPDLKRILMPDDWKGHPMRKDYPLTEERVAFKHGVKPKVPSEIIHVPKKQKHYLE